jgi:transcriptional regulator with XRE-family HTH domain
MGVIVAEITGREVKAARALLEWSQGDLALKAHVSIVTIKRLEAKGGPLRARPETLEKIQKALKEAGVTFTYSDEVGPGVAYKRPRTKKRK